MTKTKISNKLYTTIATYSLVVLLISLVATFKIMSDIKTDTHLFIKDNLSTLLQSKIDAKMNNGITNAVSIARNPNILKAINNNDKELAYKTFQELKKYYKQYTKLDSAKVHIHTADVRSFLRTWIKKKNGDELSSFRHTINYVKNTKESLQAIEVGVVGLILRSIVPIIENNNYIGSLEFLQDYDTVVNSLKKDGKHLLVFTKSELLKSKPPQDTVVHNLALSQTYFNHDFFNGFKNLNLNKLLEDEYLEDGSYFYTIKPIIDFSNNIIGYYIIGTNSNKAQNLVSKSQEVVYIFSMLIILLSIIIMIAVNISLNRLIIVNLSKVGDGLTSFFDYLNKKTNSVDKILVDSTDEIGQMAKEINTNIETIQNLIVQDDKQNWIKDGLSGLNKELSGKNDIKLVSDSSIKYICQYLNAGVGALYIYNKEDEISSLLGAYAFVRKGDISHKFKLGEGTIGQVALQKTPINLKNITTQYMSIETGTATKSDLNTYTFPLIYQDELYGIIEIGTISIFDEAQKDFFELANTIIATSLFSSIQNKKVQDLLVDSQKSNKKLKKQQIQMEEYNSELEEANTQMQEQQAQLEEANSQMEEQQTQLEEANSQMEEQQVQLKQSEEELKTQNKQLQKSKGELDKKANDLEESNKYKSEFLANMSHELRTPLNSVILLSSMLSENKKENLSEDDIKKAKIINSSGGDLLRLINDVLDLSKVEAGRMELIIDNFHSSEFSQRIGDMFEPSIHNNGLKFIVEDKYNNIINTDENKLSQIIKNFLSNSLKFTHEGTIKLIIEPIKSNKVKISVKDTGIGIAKEKQNLVFQAFTQADGSTSRKYGGTGLGLSITKELVKLMNGDISLESKEGEGSTFSIIIPNLEKEQNEVISDNSEEIHNKIIDDSLKLVSTDKTFLIIENDQQFALELKDIINRKGDYVLIANSGKKGLDLASKYNNIQGVLLNLELPDDDGIDILKELKSNIKTNKLPVYVLSDNDGKKKNNYIEEVNEFLENIHNSSKNTIPNLKLDDINFNGKTILVVDDDMRNTFVLVEILEDKEATVLTASNGKEALNILENNTNINIVLMDIMMPVMDGYEAITKIRENNDTKDIPIIAITAKAMTKDKEKSLNVGANDFLTKPLNLDSFLGVVKAWIK